MEGSCLCGSIRVRASGVPLRVSYCHCRDCRRASGAPTMVFAGYRDGQVEVEGDPEVYGSSPGVRRSFCGGCGAALSFEDDRLPGEVYVAVGIFDEPERLEPEEHAWASRKPVWLRIYDDLPRHDKDPPWHEKGGGGPS